MTYFTYNNSFRSSLSSSFILSSDNHNDGPEVSGVGGGASPGLGSEGGAGTPLEHVPLGRQSSYRQGPHIVAMTDTRQTQHQEAYYLFFVGSVGIALNVLVITMILLRRNLRRMTSAFLIHACFLNLIKAMFCIPFGLNLLSGADEQEDNQPSLCNFQGSSFIVFVTTSVVNMVAMICTEAYTFGEINVGGNSHGTSCCILFGVMVVYVTSIILHLGPTLIGGDIVYNPHIGSCAFSLGTTTGYVANVMWILIVSFSFVGVGHFLNKFYKEIQVNRPNRVSMLVRHSITLSDEMGRKPSACTIQEMTQEAMHRAKIFVITAIAFVLCWYPLFLLILIDMHFKVSPKVYQAFNFIAWTQATVEPIILICFDRNINLLSRFMYCDRDQYTASQIAYLMAQTRLQQQQQQQQPCNHDDDDGSLQVEDLTASPSGAEGGARTGGGRKGGGGGSGSGGGVVGERVTNSHNLSMEIEDAFKDSSLRGGHATSLLAAMATPVCRHCSPGVAHGDVTPLRASSNSRSASHSDTPTSPMEMQSLRHFKPVSAGRSDQSLDLEMTFNYDPVRLKDNENDVQC